MTKDSRKINERMLWDNIARSYDQKVMLTYEDAYRQTVEAILEEVNSTSRVLDVGCGTGVIAMEIVPEVNQVIGIDLSPKMIAQARKKALKMALENVTFDEGDGYATDFDSGSFDVVILANLLHVVAEPAAVVREAHRLLAPGGILLTVTDCMGEPVPPKMWLNLIELRLMKFFGRIKYFSFFRKSYLKALLEEQGFSVEKEAEFHPAPVNYYLTGRKG